jgi:hypothetical protein
MNPFMFFIEISVDGHFSVMHLLASFSTHTT